jgi:hypothetical protein
MTLDTYTLGEHEIAPSRVAITRTDARRIFVILTSPEGSIGCESNALTVEAIRSIVDTVQSPIEIQGKTLKPRGGCVVDTFNLQLKGLGQKD